MKNFNSNKPFIGFEPTTYALPWRHSTAELKGQCFFLASLYVVDYENETFKSILIFFVFLFFVILFCNHFHNHPPPNRTCNCLCIAALQQKPNQREKRILTFFRQITSHLYYTIVFYKQKGLESEYSKRMKESTLRANLRVRTVP